MAFSLEVLFLLVLQSSSFSFPFYFPFLFPSSASSSYRTYEAGSPQQLAHIAFDYSVELHSSPTGSSLHHLAAVLEYMRAQWNTLKVQRILLTRAHLSSWKNESPTELREGYRMGDACKAMIACGYHASPTGSIQFQTMHSCDTRIV
jgi:hypothetical protein